MKKLLVVLLALCMICTFAPAFAEGEYAVKGIADGDIFALSATEESFCDVYVVNADATGLTPSAPTGLASADYYVDGALIGSVSAEPFYYSVPIASGEHTLKVVANPVEGDAFEIGTYSYTGVEYVNTKDSIIETFDNGAEGTDVSFGNMTLAASEYCTYELAPETGSLAMTFSSDVESGNSYTFLKNNAVPESKIMTVDYDFYSKNSSGNMITLQLRNSGGSAVVQGYTFGTLTASKYQKDTWHHVSYVFDFNSLTFRGYLDGYEIERGALNDSANANVRFYLNRYSAGILYVDNFMVCGKVEPENVQDIKYEVKGIKSGDRFAVTALEETTQRIYVVDEGATGLKPEEASALTSADFYIDDVLAGTATNNPCYYDLPLTSGSHTLKVIAHKNDNSETEVGTYEYEAITMADSTDSVYEDFESGAVDADVTSATIDTEADETVTYQKAPETNSMAATFRGSTNGKGGYLSIPSLAIPEEGNMITLDYDFYSENSDGNQISQHLRDTAGSGVVNGIVFGTLKGNTYGKNKWHHMSFVFDFINREYRAYLDGYEFERGVVDRTSKNDAYARLYVTRYSAGISYIDNIKFCGKIDVENIKETEYAVKGIAHDGEKIPVGIKASSQKRTISVVDADYTARVVGAATNLAKAEFYIDDKLAGTVTTNPCQWDLPLNDFNEHALTVKTTDFAGKEQNFGPYFYTAVLTEDDMNAFKEYFEGTEGEAVTVDNLSTGDRIDTFTSQENPVYAKAPGRDDMAMKLTLESGKTTTFKTKADIYVPEAGIVTYDLDFYSTTGSEYYRLYLYTREAGGRNMKYGDPIILENFQMKEVQKNAWHHISYVFDTEKMEYAAFIDGYEFERGYIEPDTPGRNVYFQLTTQSYTTGEFYIDNIEITSKMDMDAEDTVEITEDEDSKSLLIINKSEEEKTVYSFRAEYDENNNLVDFYADFTTVSPGGIYNNTQSTTPEKGDRAVVYFWDENMRPIKETPKQ